jgi:hypothetical protein
MDDVALFTHWGRLRGTYPVQAGWVWNGTIQLDEAARKGLILRRIEVNTVAAAYAKLAELESKLAELEKRAATPPTTPALIAHPATGEVERNVDRHEL